MNKIERRSHQPQNGRCWSCTKWKADCDGLAFESMPVIKVSSDGIKIVRCAEYVRSGEISKMLEAS